MNAPKRLRVKLFVENPEAVAAEKVVPVFQRWIQRGAIKNELLIDVADYKHVHHGPGIVLIAHEGDYAYQFNDGRVGLSYTLKQHDSATLEDALSTALARVIFAAQLVHKESQLKGLQIALDSVQISLLDRLQYPHDAETIAQVQAAIAALFDGKDSDVQVTPVEADVREPISFTVQSPSLESLITPAEVNAT